MCEGWTISDTNALVLMVYLNSLGNSIFINPIKTRQGRSGALSAHSYFQIESRSNFTPSDLCAFI